MIFPIIVLALVFILIAVRQIGSFRLQIWQIMLGGAAIVLITGQIGILPALKSIDVDVMVFLFCMFLIGAALEESGYLAHLTYRLFRGAKNMDFLVLFILFGMGIAAAFLMNDTVAIVGTPVVLLLAHKHKTHAKVLLLALAFAVTIGSVMSPIGNPQNLLIALHGGIQNPFVTFLKYLLVPTLLNLGLAYLMLRLFFWDKFHNGGLKHSHEPIRDHKLATVARISMFILLGAIIVKIALVFFGVEVRLTYLAVLAALPVLLFSHRRFEMVRKVDWHTLIFFAAMFILMASVWNTGYVERLVGGLHVDLKGMPMIFGMGVLVSQLVSNVPLVALYLPMLQHAGAGESAMIALAAASTIAGNLLILGAASNVIIIQNAEKRSKETITFWEFARVGVPLTVLNVLVYWLFLAVF
jgi:Na+/H+ antiporter NhaD/arsenite permease-like protein